MTENADVYSDRAYQSRSIEAVKAAYMAGRKAPILVLPTGGGKTIIAAQIAQRVVQKGGRMLFMAPRRKLVKALDKRDQKCGCIG